jgi:hypothetical protein
MDDVASRVIRHTAIYTLEMGTWRATCRACGHSETDPSRRRAASVFRNHIRDHGPPSEVDLRVHPGEAGSQHHADDLDAPAQRS